MKRKGIFLIALGFILAGCPLFMTKEDIAKQDEERQLKDQVSAIQRGKADTEVRYTDLQNDIRVVAGRVDTIDHNQQVASQNHQKEIENLRKLIEAQNEKIKMIEQHIDATETRLTAAIQAMANNSASSSSASPENKTSVSKKDGGAFNEAEELFSKKEFKHAIVKYQAYREKNPKGTKIAEATYKIGVCFSELGSKKDAKEFYQETIDSFPGTPSAKKAKLRLNQTK